MSPHTESIGNLLDEKTSRGIYIVEIGNMIEDMAAGLSYQADWQSVLRKANGDAEQAKLLLRQRYGIDS